MRQGRPCCQPAQRGRAAALASTARSQDRSPADHRDTLDAKGVNRHAILQKLPSAMAGDEVAGICRRQSARSPAALQITAALKGKLSPHALDFTPKEKCYRLTAGICKPFIP